MLNSVPATRLGQPDLRVIVAPLNPTPFNPSWAKAAEPEMLGRRTRRLFRERHWFDRRRHPGGPWLNLPVLWQTALGLHALYCLVRVGGEVQRRHGRSRLRQAADMIRFAWRDGIDAQTYYQLELFRPDGARRAAQCLTRFETKNGLFPVLKRLLPRPARGRSPLGDKLAFRAHCAAHGIPTVPIPYLLVGRRLLAGPDVPAFSPSVADVTQDLFIKPRRGKGAQGAQLLHHQVTDAAGIKLYDDGAGTLRTLTAIAAARKAAAASALVQPRLRNHAAISDLALDSLIVIRVITCLDHAAQPVVTHGMLRVLGKLEPLWQDPTEYGSPIDLATGRLGPLTGDKMDGVLDWHDRHPHTDAPVTGRRLMHWPAIAALARQAHAACADRMLLGWDIALTPEGPLVVEGNAHPDLLFLQRVHRQPVAQSPLGPLLHRQLDRLQLDPLATAQGGRRPTLA